MTILYFVFRHLGNKITQRAFRLSKQIYTRHKANGHFAVVRIIVAVALLCSLFVDIPLTFAAPTLQITKSASVSSIASGQSFTYNFNYRCASITENCTGTTLTDFLPSQLSWAASDVVLSSSTPDISNYSYNPSTGKVLFTFISPLPAGNSGTLSLKVLFPNFITPNGTVATNTATMSATNAGSVPSNPVSVTATASSAWTVSKVKTSGGYIDGNTVYTVQMTPPSTGALGLTNTSMVDTLPSGAVFVSASNSGFYNSTNHTVTWTYSGTVTTAQTETVTVVYPSSTYTAGQSVTNNVQAFGQPSGQTSIISVGTASVTHTVTTPVISASRSKTVSANTIVIGSTGSYYTLSAANTSTGPVDNFTLEDDPISSQLTLNSLTTGINSSSAPVTITYKTNLNTTYHSTALANPYAGASSSTVTIASLGLASGEYITGLRYNFGTVPAGFSLTTSPRINFQVLSPDPTGTAVAANTTISNCDLVRWVYNSTAGNTTTACATFKTSSSAQGSSGKTVGNSTINIGNGSTYALTGSNTGSVSMDDFTIEDGSIPSQITLTGLTTGVTSSSNPVTLTYKTNLNGTYRSTNLSNPYAGSSSTTVTIASLGLDPGDYITGLRWDYGTLSPGFTFTTKPTIVFKVLSPDPTGTAVAASTVIQNCSKITWTVSSIAGASTNSCVNFTTAPNAAATTAKTVANNTILVGNGSTYTLNGKNSGSVALDNFTLEDGSIPTQLTLTSFTTGKNSASSVVSLSYKTNLNPAYHATNLAASYAGTTDTVIPVSGLSLASGEYITGLRWYYGTVAAGFNTSTNPRIIFNLLSPDPTGTVIASGATVQNCSVINFDYQGASSTSTSSCASFTTQSTISQPVPAKSITSTVPSGGLLPGQTATYRLKVANNGAANASLSDPVLLDLLPASLSFVSTPSPGYTVTNGSGGVAVTGTLTPTSFENIPNYNSTGRTLLRWKFAGLSVAAGKEFYVNFTVMIQSGTSPGNITNVEALTSATGATNCTVADTNDLNGDGSATDTRCEASNSGLLVGSVATLSSQKLVKGQLDSSYSLAGYTIPGGTADYKLTITNTGNIPMKNVEIIDILPYIGDTGVIDPQARLSEWRPNLIGAVSAPVGVTVYYSTAANPCRPELVSTGPSGCGAANWSVVLPADPSTVQSLKFDFGSTVLNPNASFTLGWPMRAPVGTSPGKLAWNSFGFVGTRLDDNQTLLPSEPIKVSIQLQASSAASYGDYVWVDTNWNGIQDAGETGLNGVHVDLYQPGSDGLAGTGDDVLVASTVTVNDVNGNPGSYLFPGLPPGNYFAKFTLPDGYAFSPVLQGSDTTKDSNADPTTGLTAITTLSTGENDLTWDAGIHVAPASLGDFVWYDLNRNGIQDSGELGVKDVTVTLYNSSSTQIGQTTTDSNGKYSFPDLMPGTYSVGFSNLPSGYAFSPALQGSDTTKDSDANTTTGLTAAVTLASGDNNLTLDAGINQPTASLGDYVWLDTNQNGLQDGPETGVENVTVTLYDALTSTQLNSMATDNTGHYKFINLDPGSYYVVFTLPSGYSFTAKNQGSDTTLDSDADTSTGRSDNVTLVANEENLTIDAGIFLTPTLTPVPTATSTPSNTPVPTDTPVPTTTPIQTPTDTPVATDTPAATGTPAPVPTNSPVATDTPVSTDTPTPVPTPQPVNTPVASATPTSMPVPTATPTLVSTGSPTSTPANTVTPVPSSSPGSDDTPTPRPTPTPLPTGTRTPTSTGTPTPVPGNNPTPTATPSTTVISSPGAVVVPTATVSPTSDPATTVAATATPSVTPQPQPADPSVTPDPGQTQTASPVQQTPTATPLDQKSRPTISKVSDTRVAAVGQLVKFTITVTNPGPDMADLTMTDNVPDLYEVESVSTNMGYATTNGQVVSVNLSQMNPHTTATILVTTKVISGKVGNGANTATLSGKVNGQPLTINPDLSAVADMSLNGATDPADPAKSVYPGLPHTGQGAALNSQTNLLADWFLRFCLTILVGSGGCLLIYYRKDRIK